MLQAASIPQATLSSEIKELAKQFSEFKMECNMTLANLHDQVLASVLQIGSI